MTDLGRQVRGQMRNPFEPATQFPPLGFLYELGRADLPEVPALLHLDQEAGLPSPRNSFPVESHLGVGRSFRRERADCPPTLLFQDQEMDFHLFGVYGCS